MNTFLSANCHFISVNKSYISARIIHSELDACTGMKQAPNFLNPCLVRQHFLHSFKNQLLYICTSSVFGEFRNLLDCLNPLPTSIFVTQLLLIYGVDFAVIRSPGHDSFFHSFVSFSCCLSYICQQEYKNLFFLNRSANLILPWKNSAWLVLF